MQLIKLLLVEDEVTLGEIIKESLETRHFEVIYCTNGENAWEAYCQHQPDVCVLDVMMPRKDGLTLAKEIREKDPLTPIIFLTAKSRTQDVVDGFRAGANDYLKKPFSLEELIVRIHALLKRTHLLNNRAVETEIVRWDIGDYIFDYEKQSLSRAAHNRKLTHREAALLKLLCEYQNRILERKIVLHQLWGDDSFFNARSMDVFITKLRKYLRDDSRVEIINIRGIGYKLLIKE